MLDRIIARASMQEEQKRVGWIPLLGEFESYEDHLLYRGKLAHPQSPSSTEDAEPRPGVGLALSDQRLADGRIVAEIEFGAVTEGSVCEIAVAYDANAKHVVTAGLGGESWAMFGVREFGGPAARDGWWGHRVSGDRSNLKAGRPYWIEATFRGAAVTLSLDGVAVASVDVSSPTGRRRHAGIFCRGAHEIRIRKFAVVSDKPKAFVVMQFTGEFDDLYRDVVQETCKDFDVNPCRADEINGPGNIVADIVRELDAAQLVIADITPTNPNVYFEVGYAFAAKKPTILLAKKGTALPFDVAAFRVLFYEDTIGGKKRLEQGLRRHLDAILSG